MRKKSVPFLRFLRFSTTSKFRIGVAILLMISATSEVIKDIAEMFSTGVPTFGTHHGVFLFGLAYLLKGLAELGEDLGIATEGLILASEEAELPDGDSDARRKQQRSSRS
jgi:hypothetical protein|tara:strand:- start:470 stop:799 length:330 start_codon:yes stop_codon:yes gene_type:complete